MVKQALFLWIVIAFSFTNHVFAQQKESKDIRAMIEAYKNDDRGPFKDIRWFCKDGTINLPKEPCAEKGGVQRARHKDEVDKLANTQHIFLGQILSNTSRTDFWDAENAQSRLKQYQLEKYLRAIDDGWVLRKGQFYRGAFQVEDEEAWGIEFFDLILKDKDKITQNFYLLRQAAKDIPHAGDNNRTQNIRALSKVISDDYAPFLSLRIKIHGQPDASDIAASKAFLEKHRNKLSTKNQKNFDTMIQEMEIVYRPVELSSLNKSIQQLPKESSIRKALSQFIATYQKEEFSSEKIKDLAEILWTIRKSMVEVERSKARLAMFDISIALEDILFKEIGQWKGSNYEELTEKIYALSMAAAGCGYLEMWEWEKIKMQLVLPKAEELDLSKLVTWHENARRLVEWSAGMARGVYRNTVELYSGFEPLAYGFFDDKIRSSILLPLGNAVSDLGNAVAKEANFSNQILDLDNQSSFRGLNPGYALGELVVVSGSPEEVEVDKSKIYIFHNPSSDLKPVAGIATVTEGNMVSHVQLLARNLGIPNAVLSEQNLKGLQKYSGKRIFYAVSNKGTVLMKLEKDMNEVERKLFEVAKRSEEKIAVPIDKIELENTAVLNLRDVKSKDSGKTCGPKAANLGQLKMMFPEKVVEGIVIPFSIFRQHMDQPMPDSGKTYWEFLNDAFSRAANMSDETAAEGYMLQELDFFRAAIKKIKFSSDFIKDLKSSFKNAIGEELGDIPVFLRSDTNMEDLKDFTGAGLNLTVFNVLEEEKIMQGIRDVWASPYTERSYKWRQKYLLNPENVYPSILIIPGVDVDYSGVSITKGITSGKEDDMTVAFSRGAGGAVDGQAAESYLLTASGKNILLSPAREPSYRRLPLSGGTSDNIATFDKNILNQENLKELRELTDEVNRILPTTEGVESSGPFDIELGFKDDQMWLFQIRPFVENKNAKASAYLESITPKLPGDISVSKDDPVLENDSSSASNQAETADQNSPAKWPFYLIAGVLLLGLGIYFFRKKQTT